MGAEEIKGELQQFIKDGGETFIRMHYESAKDHINRLKED